MIVVVSGQSEVDITRLEPLERTILPAVPADVGYDVPSRDRLVKYAEVPVVLPDIDSAVILVVANVEAPVTPSVPPIVALPDTARLAPVIAAVTTRLVKVPVVEKRFVLVTLVMVAFVPVRFVMLALVPVAEVYVKFVPLRLVAKKLVLVAFVKTPVDGVEAPIGVLSIVPPLMVSALTTMASVTELLGKESVFVTVRLPMFAVPMVELATVVVAKVFMPIKVLLALSRQIFEESERSEVDSPVMVAAETSSAVATVIFVVETFVIVALLAVMVPIVANVAFVVVASV